MQQQVHIISLHSSTTQSAEIETTKLGILTRANVPIKIADKNKVNEKYS